MLYFYDGRCILKMSGLICVEVIFVMFVVMLVILLVFGMLVGWCDVYIIYYGLFNGGGI